MKNGLTLAVLSPKGTDAMKAHNFSNFQQALRNYFNVDGLGK